MPFSVSSLFKTKHRYPSIRHSPQSAGNLDSFLLGSLSIIREIEDCIKKVLNEPGKIDFHGSRLGPIRPHDEVIATVDSDIMRALYVVQIESLAASKISLAKAHMAITEIDVEEARSQGYYLDIINDTIFEIFWDQVKAEVNWRNKRDEGALGLRDGWKVVTYPQQSHGEVSIARIPLPGFDGGGR